MIRKSLTDIVSSRLLFTHNERYLMRFQPKPFLLTHSKNRLDSSDSEEYYRSELLAKSHYMNKLINGIKEDGEVKDKKRSRDKS